MSCGHGTGNGQRTNISFSCRGNKTHRLALFRIFCKSKPSVSSKSTFRHDDHINFTRAHFILGQKAYKQDMGSPANRLYDHPAGFDGLAQARKPEGIRLERILHSVVRGNLRLPVLAAGLESSSLVLRPGLALVMVSRTAEQSCDRRCKQSPHAFSRLRLLQRTHPGLYSAAIPLHGRPGHEHMRRNTRNLHSFASLQN